MDDTRGKAFADSWAAAWNAHDLDAILSHFSDDVTFSSPVAARIVDGSAGVIRGKTALAAYWQTGLDLIPDLEFEILAVYVGVDTLVINYRNQNGGHVCEVLHFVGALVVEGHGTYVTEGPGPGA